MRGRGGSAREGRGGGRGGAVGAGGARKPGLAKPREYAKPPPLYPPNPRLPNPPPFEKGSLEEALVDKARNLSMKMKVSGFYVTTHRPKELFMRYSDRYKFTVGRRDIRDELPRPDPLYFPRELLDGRPVRRVASALDELPFLASESIQEAVQALAAAYEESPVSIERLQKEEEERKRVGKDAAAASSLFDEFERKAQRFEDEEDIEAESMEEDELEEYTDYTENYADDDEDRDVAFEEDGDEPADNF